MVEFSPTSSLLYKIQSEASGKNLLEVTILGMCALKNYLSVYHTFVDIIWAKSLLTKTLPINGFIFYSEL